ncbi:MAG: S-layer homology domain-containing protein [Evtepia sp.]
MDGRGAYQVLSLADVGVTDPAEGYGEEEYVGKVSTTITGGTFSSEPDDDYIATGYAATKNDAGKYVVGTKDGGALEVKPSTDSGKTSATLEGIYAGPSTEVEKPSTGAGSGTEGIAGTDVTVDLSSTGSTTTTGTVELTVNADTAKSLVSANAEALTVKSDVGTVKLDSAALGELKDVSEAVVISIAATNDEGTAPTWEVTITSGSTKIFDEANNPAGTIEISVPAPAGASDNTKVYCIDNGMEDMRAVYNEDENTLAWTTEHLSTFAALDASQEASWTTANSTSGSGTLQAALEAVDEVGGTIVVNKSATLSNANFTIKKDVTIQGTGVITATVTNEKQHAFTVAPNSTLTLDGITLKIDGNTGYGFDVQYDATLTLNNHAIVDISNISNATISSKPQGATNPGKINVNNSVITANNIRGNFSNGGVWTIGTGSEVTIDTCQSHGFSASAIIVENGATVDIKNVAYRGISINDAKGKLEIQAGGVVNVTNAGTADDPTTPRDAVYLDAKATEGLIVKAGATLNVTAGKDGNDRIELSTEAVSKSELNGTIIGTVDLPEGASHWVVTYKDNGKNWKVELVAKNSATITLPEIPDQGYNHFQGWTDQNGKHYEGRQEVTISSNMTFTAVWTYIPPANPNYRIDIPAAEGGTVTADPAAAKAGAKVTLTATPDEGYAVGTITVTDRFGDAVKVTENADGTYTFTMPNGQVTVKATFVETEEPAPAEPFPDVDENDWFYDEVVYVYENGLMNGVENNQFAPNTATNRAMLATILYRLAGEPAVSGDLPFTDVESGTWYTDAVLWAAQNGIVNGLGENTFAPMNTLTREQLVTMLYRYAEAEGYDVSAAADLSGYPDAGKVQPYAQKAMSWAVAEGIVEGMDGNLNPAGNATRAQIATILMRFCEGVAK